METRFRTQQAEQCDIEEQYSTLQEEAQGMSKRLKKVRGARRKLNSKKNNCRFDPRRILFDQNSIFHIFAFRSILIGLKYCRHVLIICCFCSFTIYLQ